MQKALLHALLMPHDVLRKLQDNGEFTELMIRQEALKTFPVGAVWEEFCSRCNVPLDDEWFSVVKAYENEVLKVR